MDVQSFISEQQQFHALPTRNHRKIWYSYRTSGGGYWISCINFTKIMYCRNMEV